MICEGWETNKFSTIVAWIASRLWYGKEAARQSLEVSLNCWECKRPRWIKFSGQSTRKEKAAQREHSGDLQKSLLQSLAEY